ncbi:MAG: 50S ribosomal protein L24 [Chlamydiia bacterium]|nr:50S ribosomal protein L24 [Chlamydiia bacterium]
MSSKWIRKGDQVVVVAGNDKGKTGEVLKRSEDRVLVQGVNIRKKHLRRNQQTPGGRVVEMEVAIHISNVSLADKQGNRIKLSVRKKDDGQRELVYRKEKKSVYRSIKKVG